MRKLQTLADPDRIIYLLGNVPISEAYLSNARFNDLYRNEDELESKIIIAYIYPFNETGHTRSSRGQA